MKFLQNWRVRKPSDDNESVYISEKFGVRTLHIGSDTVQSSMRLSKPNDLEVSYTRSMMGFLLFNPQPRSVLMIGLGGGYFLAVKFNADVLETLKNEKARLENELAKLKTAAEAVKTDVEKV